MADNEPETKSIQVKFATWQDLTKLRAETNASDYDSIVADAIKALKKEMKAAK